MLQKIAIPSLEIGVDKNVCLFEDGKVRLSNSIDDFAYVSSSSKFNQKNLQDILPSIGLECEGVFPHQLRLSYETIYSDNINWPRALGNKKFVNMTGRFLRETDSKIKENDEKGYLDILCRGRKILKHLEPARVNSKEVKLECEKRDSAVIQSLLPNLSGSCDTVRYSHGSQTGRMVVTSGPKILLLSKEDRRFFIPSDEDNVLAQVDFISLEPRVTYLLTHDNSPRDIYELMGKHVGTDISRPQLKIATISSLYGSSRSDPAISRKIFDFFNLKEITKKYLSNEKIWNLYGRPLNPQEEYTRLSHFIQSTAVDVSLLGFSKFYDNHDIIPYFMIHDSLVFECTKKVYNELLEDNLYVEIENLGNFYLSISKFTPDN